MISIFMKRLFTFGCSYTYYMWPTWADLLSVEYDYYENWAQSGLGNRAIAERLSECHVKNNFTKDDTVIIQWSTHLRYDWHNEQFITGQYNGWQTHGNAFSGVNALNYDNKWYHRFFSERSWAMHTLNHIILSIGLLESTGCNWKMTSMGDIRMLGADLEKETAHYEKITVTKKERESSDFLMWDRYPEFKIYEDKIWNNKNWLYPLNSVAAENKELYWWFKSNKDKEAWRESHPSPEQHQCWLNTYLRPELELPSDIPEKQHSIINRCREIKEIPQFMNVLEMEEFMMNYSAKQETRIFKDLHVWPNPRKGF